MRFRFQHRRYRLPLRVAVRTARALWTEREGVILRLENEQGAAGFGEAAPVEWFGTERIDEIVAACAAWGPMIEEPQLAEVPIRLGCLRAAIASARADLAAVDLTADVRPDQALAIAALLPAGRGAVAPLRAHLESGFRVFKWKVGAGDPADELGWLDELCAEMPEGARLRIDANGAWDRRRAERWLERCAERPIEHVEQPVAADARGAEDLLLGLAADYPTPLALDESLVHDGDVERWLGLGWRGVFVIKPSLLGDAAGALARLAAANARVVFSSALETAVGARAALRLAFDWPGERRALGFGVWPLFADSRFDGPALAPFLRRSDMQRLDPEATWNALG